jgi:hypothetical protein
MFPVHGLYHVGWLYHYRKLPAGRDPKQQHFYIEQANTSIVKVALALPE